MGATPALTTPGIPALPAAEPAAAAAAAAAQPAQAAAAEAPAAAAAGKQALLTLEMAGKSIKVSLDPNKPEGFRGAIEDALRKTFDNGYGAGDADAGIGGAGSGGYGNGGSGNGGSGDGEEGRNDGLAKFNPRVIFLHDVFTGPASIKTVEYLEKLLDAGVHLVFLTSRPAKGPDSADEILLNRLKNRRTNPVVVVSNNGGKISLQGRAAAPKSIVENVGYFPDAHVKALQGFKAKVERTLKLKPGALIEAEPSKEPVSFSYQVTLPRTVLKADAPAAQRAMIRRYNDLIKEAGLEYRMVAVPRDARSAIVYSMPLRFSLPRVFKAIDSQFAGENLTRNTSKFLILADSQRSPKFSSAFPKQSEIQVVASGADVEEVLGAVLGDRALPSVAIKLGKLRQYVEYWEPSHRNRLSYGDGESAGGSGGAMRGGGPVHQKFAMYTGTVIYQLMAWYYEQIWRGQHKFGTLPVLQSRLRSMWYNPMKYGVYINKPLAAVMRTKDWKNHQRGYLEYANAYVTNFYLREFGGDYAAAARDIQHNMVGLSTDRKSLINLEFTSASTGKVYKIYTRVPRTMRLDTAEGLVLTAYSYRTGKETPDDGEEFLAQTLAMSLLKGHGRIGDDGKWHLGAPTGPVIGKLRVQLEYRNSHRALSFNPEDLLSLKSRAAYDHETGGRPYYETVNGPVAQAITSAIERMEADGAYQKYYLEHEEQATKKDLKKDKKKKKTAKKAVSAKSKAKGRSGK